MRIAQFSRSARRAVVVCLAAGLTLSACSKEEDATDEDTTTATSSSSETPKPSDSKKAEKKEEEKKKRDAEARKAEAEKKAREERKASEQAKQGDAKAAPQKNADSPQRQGGGKPAGNQANDEQQIRDLIMGMNNHAADPRAYMKYRLDNACQAVLDEVGGATAFTDAGDGLASTGLDLIPRINSIDSVSVNGNTARAHVTATSQENTDQTPIDLSKEGGRWKFCG